MNETKTQVGQIRTEVHGHVFKIVIDNVAKKNSFSPQMMAQMSDAMTLLDRTDDYWVGVLCAEGPDFTAGLDMPKFFGTKAENTEIKPGNIDAFALKSRCRKPIVTAVQGICFTIGIEMMLAGDIVVAADDARFCQMESKRGIAPLGGAHFRYLTRAGWGDAMYHLFLCDEFSAARAYKIGFVQEVVAPGLQIGRAMEIANLIAKNAPIGIQVTKEAALKYIEAGEKAAIDYIPKIKDRVFSSEDMKASSLSWNVARQCSAGNRDPAELQVTAQQNFAHKLEDLTMGSIKKAFDLTGKNALVTGGSRGLGLQIAEALGEQGARVVISSRKAPDLEKAQAHLAGLGIKADWIAADNSRDEDVKRLADETIKKLGRVDILVNNAGATWGAPTEDHPIEAWDKVMNLNIRSLFLLSQQVAKRSMIPNKYGRIINLASIAGLFGNSGDMQMVAYNTSKGAVVNFTRALAGSWGRYGITANALAPGFFPSRMTKGTIEAVGVEKLAAGAPLRRIGDEDDLKGAAVLFASDAGKHITGQILAVDGGLTSVISG
jgi:NAD(P)-dependent dehydrogenase (short-subunit alcohol dehydrogenase family)/enoyl-CoA hydratase/carnithine racemase